jgi:polysaccharide pyruvyl transferase WcaK-like protein
LKALQFVSTVKKCDFVLDISEGDSFSDIYGDKRFLMHSLSKAMVLAVKTPLILSPQTIGPFAKKVNRLFASGIMHRCEKVFARDGQSMDYLRDLGLTANTTEAIDVAFRLPYVHTNLPNPSGRLCVGVNVSALMYHGGYSRSNQFGLSLDYPALVHQLISDLLGRGDCDVYLVPHVVPEYMPVEDDYALSRTLANKYPEVKITERFLSPSAAKSFISGLDFFVGARMHACIAAFSSGVPVVPTAYSRKFSGLFSSLNYDFVADCKTLDDNEVLSLIMSGLENRAELKLRIEEGNRMAQQKLSVYEDYLVDCFTRFGKANEKF